MAARNRRIHNFGQQNRLPSIEVYSTSPTSHEDEHNIICGTAAGRNSNRGQRLTKQNTQLTNFRILSPSLSPSRRNSNARISNSKSTGNLAVQGILEESMEPQPVHHASSQGLLNSRLNSSNSPSPTLRRLELRNSRSPTNSGRLLARSPRFLQSPSTSFDDYNQGDDEDKDASMPQESNMTFNSEPVTVLGNVIRPGAHETTSRKVEIRYSARNDKYKRPTNPIRMKANGWNTLVYAERNMEWLTEHCHMTEGEEVMTYLSRKPGTSSAYIEWRFDFSEAGLRVKRFSLKFPFETFEDGHVRAYLKTDSEEVPIFPSLIATILPQVRGWDKFSLIAELSCQREVCAFQHAQLFRQQLKSGFFDKQEEKYQFRVEIELYSMY